MKVVLSLQSRKMRNGKVNPKDYPYAKELIELLKQNGIYTVHVRTSEDAALPVDEVKTDLSLKQLAEVINECDAFISVDNFIQHYATYLGKKGVVIYSLSDPAVFGYKQNVNLLKDKKYLRPDQFLWWEIETAIPEAFVKPYEVYGAVYQLTHKKDKGN